MDIIFIHGLTGSSYHTWVSNTGVYWPTDLLPHDIPDTRIMAFGYDADVTRFVGPVSQNSVRDHASDLVGDLAAIRGTVSPVEKIDGEMDLTPSAAPANNQAQDLNPYHPCCPQSRWPGG